MAAPKILVIPGSLRAKSYNVRLAALASKELTLADADVTRISLEDYPLPIYEAEGCHLMHLGAGYFHQAFVDNQFNLASRPLLRAGAGGTQTPNLVFYSALSRRTTISTVAINAEVVDAIFALPWAKVVDRS